jgi:hypothetical protein
MPRLVRRKPFLARVKDYLNPGDFLLWLSEEFETREWDSKQVGTPLSLGLHVVILIARANSGSSYGEGDDVFGDYENGSGWLSYIVRDLHKVNPTLLTFTGHLLCPSFNLFLYCERYIHILSEATLPTV